MPRHKRLIEDSSKYVDIRFCGHRSKSQGVYLFEKDSSTPLARFENGPLKGDLIQSLQVHNKGDGKNALSREDYGRIQRLSGSGIVSAYAKDPFAFDGAKLDEVKRSIMKDFGISEPIRLAVQTAGRQRELTIISRTDQHIIAILHLNESGSLDAIIANPVFEELTSRSLLSVVINATQQSDKENMSVRIAPTKEGAQTIGYTVELWGSSVAGGECKRLGEVEFDTRGGITNINNGFFPRG